MKKISLLAFILLLSAGFVQAQLSIAFPMERQVFQRDNTDHAFIQITGNFTVEYDSIQAQVTVRPGTTKGTNTGWKTINYRDAAKPYFYGKLQAEGGWYSLEVRAMKNGTVVGTASRDRVGIGEVFVIAGQSNSTGTTTFIENNVKYGVGFDNTEDRSMIMHYANKFNNYGSLPIGFSQMNASVVPNDTVFIGPFQIAPWCWGRFAEGMVDSLNVPILLYGAGFGGTSVLWWKESANGEHVSVSPEHFVKEQYGHPYGALKSVLSYYASLTGLRAVLWHQGEADHSMTGTNYTNNLNSVIERSRVHSDHSNLAWVVARATWSQGNAPHIIVAQNNVINADPNVFAGPETDNLFGYTYRSDNIHLDKDIGLSSHSDYWINSVLNNGVLLNSNPIMASDYIEPNFICTTNNINSPIELNVGGSFSKYAWSDRQNTANEAEGTASDHSYNYYHLLPPPGYERLNWTYDSTSSITAPAGRYAVNVRKPTSGKVLFSPIMDLNPFTLPTAPSAAASVPQIRPGDAVNLTGSNCNGTYQWSTGSFANPLSISPVSTTSYTVACKTLHCLSSFSAPVEVVVSSCFGTPLSLSGAVNATEAPYQSKQTISSTQQINNPAGNIDYTAKNHILLSPGFQAKSGAIFEARIQDCP